MEVGGILLQGGANINEVVQSRALINSNSHIGRILQHCTYQAIEPLPFMKVLVNESVWKETEAFSYVSAITVYGSQS